MAEFGAVQLRQFILDSSRPNGATLRMFNQQQEGASAKVTVKIEDKKKMLSRLSC